MSKGNITEYLGTGKISKLLVMMALPTIGAQFINLLYNLVDRMYIGHIEEVGKLALTGVGVGVPLIIIMSAFAAFVSAGCAPRASIFLGQKDYKSAEHILGNSLALLMVFSLILTIVFQIFADDLLMMFGASENTIYYASRYLKIYSLGTIFVQITLGMNSFISAQGFAKISMLSILIGAICNIVLDPLFIFVFDMDTAGAAYATIISQAISMIWILRFLTGKKTNIRIKRKYLRLSPRIIFPGMAMGFSPFVMGCTDSLIGIVFNTVLFKYGGDLAVGAMTILFSVFQFSMLPVIGLSQSAQPILSYNYGAGNANRVKKAFKLTIQTCTAYSLVLWLIIMLFPQIFVLIFNNDPQMVAFASHALRIFMSVALFTGIRVSFQIAFISLGNAKSSLFLVLLRKLFLMIPLIYVLPLIFNGNTDAIFLAQPVADMITVIVGAFIFKHQFRKTLDKLN